MARSSDTPTTVRFYQLGGMSLADAIAGLANKAYDRGLKCCILAKDAAHAAQLDQHLWRFPADSFLPHGRRSEPDPERQPVLIAATPDDCNGATVMLVATETLLEQPPHFDLIIDFAFPEHLAHSRLRFRQYLDAGCNMEYWEQTEQGWKKK